MNSMLQTPFMPLAPYASGLMPCFTPSQLSVLSHNQLFNLSHYLQNLKEQATPFMNNKSMAFAPQFYCQPQQQILNKRVRQSGCFDTEGLDYVQKKVKSDETESNVSTQDGEHVERNTFTMSSPFSNDENSLTEKIKSPKQNKNLSKMSQKSKVAKKSESKKEAVKIEQIVFDCDREEVMFKVGSKKGEQDLLTLTREEILKKDPMALLNFYEKHLQFAKTPEFKPENLKKLQN
jgi:phosphoribosyl-AMP cyclohydrolase